MEFPLQEYGVGFHLLLQVIFLIENDVEQFDEIKRLVAFYRNSQRGVA